MKRLLDLAGWLLANSFGLFLAGLIVLGEAINAAVILLVAAVCVVVNLAGIALQYLFQFLRHPRRVLQHGFRGDEKLFLSW